MLQPDDNYDELISVCDKAILKFPNQLQFLQKKGQILQMNLLIFNIHRQKSYIQAIEIYDELIQKQKKEVEFYEMKISILRKYNIIISYELYKKKISKQLDDNINKEDQNRLDWINEQIKACYAQVIQEIGNESLEMDRIQFLYLYKQPLIIYAIDEKQQAIVFLENMMKKYPKNVEGCLFKANILVFLFHKRMLFDQKQFEQGLELYDEIISQDPENIQLYETKARQLIQSYTFLLLEKQQRWVDALSCINQALQKSPQSLHLYLQKCIDSINLMDYTIKYYYYFQLILQLQIINEIIIQKLNLIKIARQCIRMIPNIYYDTDQEMEQCDF